MPSIFSLDDLPIVGSVIIPGPSRFSRDKHFGSLIEVHSELIGPDWRSLIIADGQYQQKTEQNGSHIKSKALILRYSLLVRRIKLSVSDYILEFLVQGPRRILLSLHNLLLLFSQSCADSGQSAFAGAVFRQLELSTVDWTHRIGGEVHDVVGQLRQTPRSLKTVSLIVV